MCPICTTGRPAWPPVEHHVAGRDEGRGRGLEPDYGLARQDDRALPGAERLLQQFRRPLVQRVEGGIQVMQDRPAQGGQGGRRRSGRAAGQVERRIAGSRVSGLVHVATSSAAQFLLIRRNLST